MLERTASLAVIATICLLGAATSATAFPRGCKGCGPGNITASGGTARHNPHGEDSRGLWQINASPSGAQTGDMRPWTVTHGSHPPYARRRGAATLTNQNSVPAGGTFHGRGLDIARVDGQIVNPMTPSLGFFGGFGATPFGGPTASGSVLRGRR